MKKTRVLLAVLMCIAMLTSLLAVNVSAAGETVVSEANFMGLASADKGAASHAAMEAQGVTIPEDSGAWQIVSHFYQVALPADGYSTCTYIQTLEAGEGKVFATDVAFEVAYGLACKDADGNPLPEVGHLIVYVSTDGQNWTEGWANRKGQGKLYDSTAFAVDKAALAGTAGQSKIYIKVEMVRFSAETSGCMGYTKLSSTTVADKDVIKAVDFRGGATANPGEDSNKMLNDMGFETVGNWWVQSCYTEFATPKEGYEECALIQTFEAGRGKVFSEDVTLSAGYMQAPCSDPNKFKVEVSTDGETWTEVYVDEAGHGAEDMSAMVEGTLTLPGTEGASKIYVKYSMYRHMGPLGAGLVYSVLSADVEGGTDVSVPTGDPIGMVVALLAISGTALVVLKKKEN